MYFKDCVRPTNEFWLCSGKTDENELVAISGMCNIPVKLMIKLIAHTFSSMLHTAHFPPPKCLHRGQPAFIGFSCCFFSEEK